MSAMKTLPLRLLCLLLFGLAPLLVAGGDDRDSAAEEAAVPRPGDAMSQPAWLEDLGLATSIAAERDRPLMVVFR
jgi:hypothetical protein